MKGRILGVAVVVSLARASAAWACGPTAPPEYVLQDVSPTGVALLNQPIVVRLQAVEGTAVDAEWTPQLSLATRANPQLSIPLTASGSAPKLVWVPLEPLQPDTEYEAIFASGDPSEPVHAWTFNTGRETSPPFTLEGELAVTFEQGTDTRCASATPCSCIETEPIAVIKARVKIPRALGGFPARFGAVYLTDDHPYDFTTPTKNAPEPYHGRNVSGPFEAASLEDPTLGEVLITVPDEDVPYRPCFAFQASDERGDVATAEPLCVDFPHDVVANGSAGAATLPEDGNADDPARTSKGCSFTPTSSHGGAWLVSFVLVSLLRRRRD